jgi:hypothetical protein
VNGESAERADGSELASEYRRLLRWYPRAWRTENEEAMLGALLDQAESDGRNVPTAAERSAIAREGLRERFGLPHRGQRLRLLPLAAGFLLSVFYALLIIWAPNTSYPGSVGPFANPSILTCVLLVAAFLAALLVRGKAASVLALAAAVAEIVIGIVAAMHPPFSAHPWEGPGSSAVVLFAGIAILGAVLSRQGRMLTAGTLLVLAAVAATLVVSFTQAELGLFSPVSIALTLGIAVAVTLAIILLVVRRRPRRV